MCIHVYYRGLRHKRQCKHSKPRVNNGKMKKRRWLHPNYGIHVSYFRSGSDMFYFSTFGTRNSVYKAFFNFTWQTSRKCWQKNYHLIVKKLLQNMLNFECIEWRMMPRGNLTSIHIFKAKDFIEKELGGKFQNWCNTNASKIKITVAHRHSSLTDKNKF